MGWFSCDTAELVVSAGQIILAEFSSKSTLGQLSSAIGAPKVCREPTSDDQVEEYMKCSFLKSQREAWEIVLVLFALLTLAVLILSFRLYNASKKIVKTIVTANNRVWNMAMISAAPMVRQPASTSRGRLQEPDHIKINMTSDDWED